MSLGETVIESVSENLKTLLLVGGAYVVAAESGMVDYPAIPSLPGWWPLVGLLVGSVFVAGVIVASELADLLEDEDAGDADVIVREVVSDSPEGVEYGFTDEGFDNAVIYGDLRYLEDAEGSADRFDAYDVHKDPGWTDNPGYPDDRDPSAIIYGTYLGQEPDSSLVGHYDGADARREIKRIKNQYEDDAAAGRILIEHYPVLMRRLDRERTIRWVQKLGGDVSADFQGESGITDAMRDVLPMDLLPNSLLDEEELTEDESEDDQVGTTDETQPSLGQAIATLVDNDGAAEFGPSSGEQVATDGGEPDG